MYRWISCRSIVERIHGTDKRFGGKYIVDPYQKCDLCCVYCDAAEDIIYIKHNAVEILINEIERIKRGRVILGSATDPYQRIEEREGLTREVLKILTENGFPVHILTKSSLVERDIDIMKSGDVRVTISFSTMDENISRIIEPEAPAPERRLKTVERLSKEGIRVGVAVFPLIPYVSDVDIERDVKRFKDAGASYLIYEYLELKGYVREKFFGKMERFFPEVCEKLRELYRDSYKPKDYKVDDMIVKACKKVGLRLGYG